MTLKPLVVALLACLAFPALAQDDAAPEPKPRPVKLETLEPGGGALEREFFGRVRARETVDLAFQVAGQITEFPVTEGTRLTSGDLVAQLDLTPFQRAVDRAEVDLAKAERDLARLQELQGSAISAVQVRDAQTTVDLARIAAEEARDRLEDATLKTAFDALVARRELANYSTVAAGTPVVRLHDMSELRVDIEVPEVLFRSASGGREVTFDATFPGDPQAYPLELREYEAETAEIAQTYSMTLGFTGEVPSWVLPGASVTVTARAERPEGETILLPETALVFDADRQPGVMVFLPGDGGDVGSVEWRPVEIDMRDDARIGLVEGPPAGTKIVVSGGSQLRDGQKVRRFTAIGE
ncbi:efflux RND transporter periplasmic adaptor subunit [Palleronia sediminis]|uniref:Efflux RND transporter periplasmic adaptor subunit n=1 Tax=Palleronia sediminis TaxID=2547833 RepID=A0A4R6A5W9_9RHOB|nr:efflux RND transporter periplasmic adaptor subunit [Palleronia sediminis]TDL78255.1 efflux RND transporter periplasmic adaptor subunit [Palleronia sediminis]